MAGEQSIYDTDGKRLLMAGGERDVCAECCYVPPAFLDCCEWEDVYLTISGIEGGTGCYPFFIPSAGYDYYLRWGVYTSLNGTYGPANVVYIEGLPCSWTWSIAAAHTFDDLDVEHHYHYSSCDYGSPVAMPYATIVATLQLSEGPPDTWTFSAGLFVYISNNSDYSTPDRIAVTLVDPAEDSPGFDEEDGCPDEVTFDVGPTAETLWYAPSNLRLVFGTDPTP